MARTKLKLALAAIALVVADTGVAAGLEAILTEAQRVERHGFIAPELERTRRNVIRALANPDQERATRTLLREHFGIQAQGLKALLAAAPLEGIDLRRGRDFGRKVELNYLIDTNIIFEIRKGRRCDPNVARWYEKKRGCESVS